MQSLQLQLIFVFFERTNLCRIWNTLQLQKMQSNFGLLKLSSTYQIQNIHRPFSDIFFSYSKTNVLRIIIQLQLKLKIWLSLKNCAKFFWILSRKLRIHLKNWSSYILKHSSELLKCFSNVIYSLTHVIRITRFYKWCLRLQYILIRRFNASNTKCVIVGPGVLKKGCHVCLVMEILDVLGIGNLSLKPSVIQ